MQNNISYGSTGQYPSASSLYGSAIMQPALTQSTAITSGYSPSFLSTSSSASSGASSTQSQGYLKQVFDMAMQVAQVAIQKVLQTILPVLGLGSSTSDASAMTGMGSAGSASSLLPAIGGSGLVTNTAASTKKNESWLDKVESWFGSLGKFGTSIKNTISSGQEVVSPFSSGLGSLWTKAKDFLGGIFGTGSDSLLGSAISSIASIF